MIEEWRWCDGGGGYRGVDRGGEGSEGVSRWGRVTVRAVC